MLSRRILRIKVLQSLYSFFQAEDERIDVAERNLLNSIDNLYDLFIYQLSIFVELNEYFRKRMEENKLKHRPTPEELNPNTKFVDNRFVKQLSENKHFQLKYNQLKINWSEEEETFKALYKIITESNYYEKYMRSTDTFPYASDKKIMLIIFKRYILDSEAIENYFEDKNIHWGEDYFDVASLIIYFIEEYKEEYTEDHPLPELFKTTETSDPESDLDFIKQLFRKTIVHSKEYGELISGKTINWDIDRLAVIDVILLKMALTEILEMPSIPVRVTMNEYIDISKDYSSEKSSFFINGIIDKIATDLNRAKKIKKDIRGLIEE